MILFLSSLSYSNNKNIVVLIFDIWRHRDAFRRRNEELFIQINHRYDVERRRRGMIWVSHLKFPLSLLQIK